MDNLISLYSVYHKPSHIIRNNYIKPIQVGNQSDIPGICFRDNRGDNISDRNATFCELTAQYWAWKNDLVSDYIGIMHYRRYFDFNSQEDRDLNIYGLLEENEFTLDFVKKYGLSESNIRMQVEPFDIILPFEWDVKAAGWKNIKHNYITSEFHHERDLDAVRRVIQDLYPEYIPYFDKVMNQNMGVTTNMFIMKRRLHDEYSDWLFDILFELEKRIDISSYDMQEKRVFGYLSERLLNIWLYKKVIDEKNLKINYLRRVFVHDTTAKKWCTNLPNTSKKIVSIVIASDNNYVAHLGSLISSIQSNISKAFFLDLIILDGGISEHNRFLLSKMLVKDAEIQFLDLKSEFSSQSVHMHFSKATFYRLILERLIQDREKVLYIDCDTIVLGDLSELFFTDLEDKAIGAVFDYIMHHFCQTGVPSISTIGSIKSKEYLQHYVGLKDNWDKYFQAGVILFDLDKLRKLDLSEVMMKSLMDKKYWFLDQDILNKYFLGNVKYLEPKWNVVNCGDEVRNGLSDRQLKELDGAILNPKIIHYAGYETKPWNNINAKFNEFYFYYLRTTFWYESVMFSQKSNSQENNIMINVPSKSLKWKVSRKIWKKMPSFMKVRLNKLKEYLKNKL
ncbi:glycosyl transferase [Chelonobacter oris]|uniref:Glycosyl transferase n=1 Tax=Chelonobacter oris TaxID=505317 RepID=A0A0A3APM3_9PAST|nr:DUF4422 domain-containing protein [Chelonobacter oris]KGQ71368.1 glycosyl transferase [Chelonobacter oris]